MPWNILKYGTAKHDTMRDEYSDILQVRNIALRNDRLQYEAALRK